MFHKVRTFKIIFYIYNIGIFMSNLGSVVDSSMTAKAQQSHDDLLLEKVTDSARTISSM